VQAAVEEAIARLGRIDIVVNNAGIAALDPIHQMRSEVLHAIIDSSLKGAMYVAKHTVEPMIARHLAGEESGKIINIASAVVGRDTGCCRSMWRPNTRSSGSRRRGPPS
jgi:(-)-trans-carveol dehydrogenase